MAGLKSFAWEKHITPVYWNTSVSFLINCPSFQAAKCGDMRAAQSVVNRCTNSIVVNKIRQNYPNAVLLPVNTNNKLPEALAVSIGMKTHKEVYSLNTRKRRSLSAMERLLHKPRFSGGVVKGENYIIIDDVITQGGTVSELRKHVINNGGNILAVVVLSCSVGSNILAPDRNDIVSLVNRFSLRPITNTLRQYNIAYDVQELTKSQVRYLLLFKELNGIIDKIERTQAALSELRR